MKIALIGATGYGGSHLLNEALDRGHEVTAIVRHPDRVPVRDRLLAVQADVRDVDKLAEVLAGNEAIISAFSAERDAPNKFQDMVDGAKAIIEATKKSGVKRLLVVGGAGSLLVAPGQELIDQPDFPPDWKAGAGGTREFLHLLREEPGLDWVFLSPAKFLTPGERTGQFRLGGDQVLMDAEGQCRISLQDYAVAMIDELEQPKHLRQRFCVAY
jgi:uncharacterized protein